MTAAARRRRTARSSGPSRCRYCGADIMWVRHPVTAKMAPIDWYPVPGGNILVHGDSYEVLVGAERAAMDPTVEDDGAAPTLRVNHHTTCTSTRGRSSTSPSAADYARWAQPTIDIASLRAGERPEPDDD